MKTSDKGITEKVWTAQVIEVAHMFGYLVAHFRPAINRRGHWQTPVQADGAGFPDLVLCKPGRNVKFVELKTERGKLSPAQERWLNDLRLAGQEVYVWRPSDWNKAVEVLR